MEGTQIDANTDQLDPYVILAGFPGAPSKDKVESWKAQAPANRVVIVPLQGNRLFIVRGINGIEMRKIQGGIAQTVSDPENEFRIALVAHATLWTNITADGKLRPENLLGTTAGLAAALEAVISRLSDFYDPIELFTMVADL